MKYCFSCVSLGSLTNDVRMFIKGAKGATAIAKTMGSLTLPNLFFALLSKTFLNFLVPPTSSKGITGIRPVSGTILRRRCIMGNSGFRNKEHVTTHLSHYRTKFIEYPPCPFGSNLKLSVERPKFPVRQ